MLSHTVNYDYFSFTAQLVVFPKLRTILFSHLPNSLCIHLPFLSTHAYHMFKYLLHTLIRVGIILVLSSKVSSGAFGPA